jgi:hypothetical protein
MATSMTTQQIAAIAFAAALAQITGCSKVRIELDKPRQTETGSAPSPTEVAPAALPSSPITSAPVRQGPAERIVEIDRLLSAPLTGTPEESDQRAVLRAERAALADSYPEAVVRNQSVGMRDQASRSQDVTVRQGLNRDIVNYGPAGPPQSQNIIVAPDSQGDHDPHHMSALEAMTPTERARYFRYLRLTNPNPIVPIYPNQIRY